jgi:hypothetical protein
MMSLDRNNKKNEKSQTKSIGVGIAIGTGGGTVLQKKKDSEGDDA